MNWDALEITHAVVHYVPTDRAADDEDRTELVLTDEAITLDGPLRAYFRDKLATRLATKGMEVVVDDEQSQLVPDAVAAVLDDPESLVEQSREIALHLHEVQSRVNSSGLLAVVLGAAAGQPCVAIMKLEPERGVRFAISAVDGRHTVDLELLRDLTLTDKTKVYKTALLRGDTGAIDGWVADDQRTATTGAAVATFFLSRFLGCGPKLPAAITTSNFVKAASATFNRDVADPAKRSRYHVALVAMLQDNTTTVTPRAFAVQHLDAADRPAFLKRVQSEAKIDPAATFPKDLERVNVERFSMTFTDGGLTLVGDAAALGSTVEVPPDNADGEPVQLHTKVDNVFTGR